MRVPEGSVLCAVSGGADSVALLRMLAEAGRTVTAAHYNHGLRDEADGDEAFVRELCGRWKIPLVCERGRVPKGAGVEETAREMRYIFLERARARTGADWIATAHTADDNAETVLLNLTRGAGLHGLCGIPPMRGHIVRPILWLSRDDVVRYLTGRDIPWREDGSNADTVYRRNLIRHRAVPALKEVNPALTDAVTRLTGMLCEDEAYLTGLAREEIRRHGTVFPAKQLINLPKPVSSRVCRLLVLSVAAYPPEREGVEAMLDIAAGGNGRRRHLAGGLTVLKEKGRIYIMFTNESEM